VSFFTDDSCYESPYLHDVLMQTPILGMVQLSYIVSKVLLSRETTYLQVVSEK
jgi:hypothetical protein